MFVYLSVIFTFHYVSVCPLLFGSSPVFSFVYPLVQYFTIYLSICLHVYFCLISKGEDTWTKEDRQTTGTATQVHPGNAAQIVTSETTGNPSRNPVSGRDTRGTLPRFNKALGIRGPGKIGTEEGALHEVETSLHKSVDLLTIQNMKSEEDQNLGNDARWNVEQKVGNTRKMLTNGKLSMDFVAFFLSFHPIFSFSSCSPE